MQHTLIRIFFYAFALMTSQTAQADQLIAKNWLSSGEDWYLIEDSVKWTGENHVYAAVSYIQTKEPRDYLEVYDNDFNVIGRKSIGTYRSYAFFSIFKCDKKLLANDSIMYFSTDRPTKGKVVHEEVLSFGFRIATEKKLFNAVCAIGRSLGN